MPTLAFDPEETTHWEATQPRTVAPEKWKQFEGYASEIFTAFGMTSTHRGPNPHRPVSCARCSTRHQGTRATPSSSPPFRRSAAAAPTATSRRSSRDPSSSSRCASTTRFRFTVMPTSVTSRTRRSSASQSSRAWSECSLAASLCRSALAWRSPTSSFACSSLTASPFTFRQCTSAPRCGECARVTPAP